MSISMDAPSLKQEKEARRIIQHFLAYRREGLEQARPLDSWESIGLTKAQIDAMQKFTGAPNESMRVLGIPVHIMANTEELL